MNVRHLEILEAIAQTGTFTGAAQKLYLTQSAVSHAMAELEQQTGTLLFERLPRGVRLTQCGLLLLEEAERMLAAFRNLEQRMSSLEDYASIRIASSITIASFHLPKVLKRNSLRVFGRIIGICQSPKLSKPVKIRRDFISRVNLISKLREEKRLIVI